MKLSGSQIGILVFGLTTALLHLLLFPAFHYKFDMVVLNGFGYLGLLGAYFLPIPFFQSRHKLVRQVLIGFAILTIAAWIFIWVIQYVLIQGVPFFSHDSLYGVPAKLAEVALIILLRADKQ